MTTVLIILSAILGAFSIFVLPLWVNARCYKNHSVNPADYPWLERAARETPEQMAQDVLAKMSPQEKRRA
jgi:hypothetical protein